MEENVSDDISLFHYCWVRSGYMGHGHGVVSAKDMSQ